MATGDNWQLILAGPILRRVEPTLVSVWVALSAARNVRLDVYSELVSTGPGSGTFSGPPSSIFNSSGSTIRIGDKLHLAVVTVKIPPSSPLQPGQLYSYNLTFSGGGPTADLKSLGLLQDQLSDDTPNFALGYQDGFLPSFAMPPILLEQL